MGQRRGARPGCTGFGEQGEGQDVGESRVEQAVDKAALKADKHVAKELDVESKDIDKAVREAATEVS